MSFNLTSLNECFDSNSPFCKIDFEDENNAGNKDTNNVSRITDDNVHKVNNNYSTNNKIRYEFEENVEEEESKLDEIYKAFVEYFGNIMMSKYKMMGPFCAYVGKIKTGLAHGSRIIVVVIPDDGMNLGALRSLHTLHWLNFQTRYTKDDLLLQDYNMPETKNAVMNTIIKRVKRTDLRSDYITKEYKELQITLFRKRESIQDWSNENRLFVALNTFCCSVDII